MRDRSVPLIYGRPVPHLHKRQLQTYLSIPPPCHRRIRPSIESWKLNCGGNGGSFVRSLGANPINSLFSQPVSASFSLPPSLRLAPILRPPFVRSHRHLTPRRSLNSYFTPLCSEVQWSTERGRRCICLDLWRV